MSLHISDNSKPFGIDKKAEAIVLITTTLDEEKIVFEQLRQLDELTEAYIVRGPYDLLAKFKAKDHHHLHDLLGRKIKKIEGVRGTKNLLIA